MKKTRKQLFVLGIILIFIIAGCSNKAPADNLKEVEQESTVETEQSEKKENEETSETSADSRAEDEETTNESELDLSELESFSDLSAILNRFSLLSYEFSSPEGTNTVTVRLIGEENVNGETADHIQIEFSESGSTEIIEFWVNSNGDTVKMIQDGEEIPGQAAGMMGASMLMGFFWPFMTAESMDLAGAIDEGNSYSPFHIANVTKETRQFGNTSAEVYIFNVEMSNLDSSGSYTWEVSDFGQFKLFTRWQMNLYDGSSNGSAEFRVIDLRLK